MNRIVLIVLMLISFSVISSTSLQAQDKKAEPELDKSPLDISYFPVNFPMLKLQDKTTESLKARVIYSRPQMNNRKIFGNLVEYNRVWRLGANEATEIEFFTNAVINNVKVKKGRYSLFAIPDSANWTFILNRETDVWGSFRYNENQDVVRMKVPLQERAESLDFFALFFTGSGNNSRLIAAWDKVQAALPISFQ